MGNALGADDAETARLAVCASILVSPCVWLCLSTLLWEPHLQSLIARVFTDASDALLLAHLHKLLLMLAVMLLFDGWQLTLQGFLQVRWALRWT